MSEQTNETPFRYTAAMAGDIEVAWQDRWEEEGTFNAPNPAGPWADPEAVAERGEKLVVLDMFPYPSGAGLHVGHPLGYIATDVQARAARIGEHVEDDGAFLAALASRPQMAGGALNVPSSSHRSGRTLMSPAMAAV